MKHFPFAKPSPQFPRFCPEPHLAERGAPRLRDAARNGLADFELPHGRDALRAALRSAPIVAMGVLFLLTLIFQLMRDRSDYSEIELVMLLTPPVVELPPEPEVVPEPEPLPEPELVAEVARPVVVDLPEAPPEVVVPEIAPVKIAEAPPEPLPPLPVAPPPRVKPTPRPKPQIVAAVMPKPELAPPPRAERSPKLRRAPQPKPATLRPPVELAAAPQLTEAPEALPTRVATTRPFRPVQAKPAATVRPLAPAQTLVDAAPPSPRPTRAQRELPIRASRDRAVAPPPVAIPQARPTSELAELSREPRRSARALPSPARNAAAKPAIDVAVPAAPAPSLRASAPPQTRSAARLAPPRAARQAARAARPTVAPAAARALAAQPQTAKSSARSVVRSAVPAPSDRSSASERERLNGVPLGSLEACVSDREETTLKQALLSSVKTQKECRSAAGHYRFLQTKNLNAFLMWVAPAPSRAVADRCIELAHALDCVKKQTITESRKR